MFFFNDHKNSFEYNLNFLYFVTSSDTNLTGVKNSPADFSYTVEYEYLPYLNKPKTDKIKLFLFFFKKIIFLNTLFFLKNINKPSTLKPSCTLTYGLPFYSYNIDYQTSKTLGKNNFSSLILTNLYFYINVKKYYSIFNFKIDDKINLQKQFIFNLPDISQEILEIKPDKLKKIFFKKKQIKTFTYLNELKKKLTYIDIEDVDANILKKQLTYKNIFINSITTANTTKMASYSNSYNSNKSVIFWKRNYKLILKSNITIYNYTLAKAASTFAYTVKTLIANNFSNALSTLDSVSSSTFVDTNLTKINRDDIFKKMFLYNFMNLYTKVANIDYNAKYSYSSHLVEFKDYFFNKTHPFSRDVTIGSNKNLNKFNNFFPLYCLSFKKFKKLILFSKKQQSPVYSSYYMYYLVNFLELMCKKKIWIRINTKKQISDEIYSKFVVLFTKNRADQVNIGKHFFLIEFYEIIYLAFINRDINFFAMWFKKIMEKIHLKKHRKAVKVVHGTIRNNPLFLELTGVKGFSMDVRGKLGTAGNSKKKHYAFTVGSIAPTTKSHGLNLYQTTIRTSTGVLGVTILMSY